MPNAKKVVGLTALLVLAALAAIPASRIVIDVYEHGKFDLNGQRVWNLARAVAHVRPGSATGDDLARALMEAGLDKSGLNDAWGRPLGVAVWRDGNEEFHYRVISLGSDGRVGPCALPRCKSLAADWIVEDGEFTTHVQQQMAPN